METTQLHACMQCLFLSNISLRSKEFKTYSTLTRKKIIFSWVKRLKLVSSLNLLKKMEGKSICLLTLKMLYKWYLAIHSVAHLTCPLRADSHFDISVSININISIRKTCMNRDYISICISISISTRNGTFSIFLCLCLCFCCEYFSVNRAVHKHKRKHKSFLVSGIHKNTI